ncbi:hypothetical protein B0J11DRAFT_578673 [Dendryphion nanum]|uniref:CFEM domain-containing protein n=1 Tax=Dendryphion nanum TaxID=256645 RepID=A0A9P9E0F4_9PLEO|nr:hypothetical protein B0J11DRAFT_578673 [Dendryphion nanum]
MHFQNLLTLFSFAIIASAQLTFNITQALAPGNFQKYRCLTTEMWNSRIPKCLHQCQIEASKKDCCAFDDFACRCANTQVFSDFIEPCAFPPAMGGSGTCTIPELLQVRPMVTDLCNFFNATLYAAYTGCPQPLSKKKTYGIVASEEVIITH